MRSHCVTKCFAWCVSVPFSALPCVRLRLNVRLALRPRLHWARTDKTQQSGQTPENAVNVTHITVYFSGKTETDTTGMLSPNNGRISGANKVGFLLADSLARHLLQCAWDSSVFAINRTYVIELVRDVPPLRIKETQNYPNRVLKPKYCNEIREKLNVEVKYWNNITTYLYMVGSVAQFV